MELLLTRKPSLDGCTLGQLFVDGKWDCFTLEDAVRTGPKIQHETAIPAGRYRVLITRSERFGRMLPILLDVPGFTGIRIHPGNTAADTSGCILVGHASSVNSVLDSHLAMNALQPKIAAALAQGVDVFITIADAKESVKGLPV